MTAEKRQKEHHSMSSRFLPKLNYSNVIATIALFVALGGAAVAAGLPKHSVGPKQLKRGAVTAAALRKGAVTSGKLAPKSVVNGKIGPNAISPGNIGNGAVTSAKIAAGSVIASTIKNGVITNPKLGNGVVNTAKLAANAVTTPILANGSVTPAKLSFEVGGTVSTLKTGQTLRGVFDLGDGSMFSRSATSFPLPLLNAPSGNVLQPNTNSAACPGLGGGGVTPQATGGQLCVYITSQSTETESLAIDTGSLNRLGFGLLAKFKKAESGLDNFVQGQWAVTAP
jgi:trimeric autotransporter adhesin